MNIIFKHKKLGFEINKDFFNEDDGDGKHIYITIQMNTGADDNGELIVFRNTYTLLDILNSDDFILINKDDDFTEDEYRYISYAVWYYGGRDDHFEAISNKLNKKIGDNYYKLIFKNMLFNKKEEI